MPETKGAFRAGRVVAADSKWTGEEPVWTNWEKMPLEKFMRERSRMLSFYSYYLVADDLIRDAQEWMEKRGYSKEDQRLIRGMPNGAMAFTAMKFARAMNRGFPAIHPRAQEHFDSLPYAENAVARNDEAFVRTELFQALKVLRKVRQREDATEGITPKKPMPTIQDRIRQKVEKEVISKIDQIHDIWSSRSDDVESISLVSYVRDSNVPPAGYRYISDWLERVRSEYDGALKKECPQLVEGYSYLTRKGIQNRIKALDKMLEEISKLSASKKAQKKPRAKKPKDATKQVSGLKYQADSQEFGISSVDPTQIPSSYRVVLFNTKYRTLSLCQAETPAGLEVKGSTIRGFDPKASFTASVRKPNDVLTKVMSAAPKKLDWAVEGANGRRYPFNGRVNDKTIILRVLDQKAA